MSKTVSQDSTRARTIEGLLQFAQFLATHPDIEPGFMGYNTMHCVRADTDADGIAEVERMAAALGVTVNYGEHITAEHQFAGFGLRVYYIPQALKGRRLVYAEDGPSHEDGVS